MAAMSTTKFTELPQHFLSTFSLPSRKRPFSLLLKPFSSIRTTAAFTTTGNTKNRSQNPKSKSPSPKSKPSHSSSWLNKWPSTSTPIERSPGSQKDDLTPDSRHFDESSNTGTTAIERIVLRLRNLGLGSDDEEEEEESSLNSNVAMNVTGDEKLGDLLRRDWVRPDKMLVEDENEDTLLFPWERSVHEAEEVGEKGVKRRTVKAPTLADLTIEDGELRRLRRQGMILRERINVPKAGVTAAVLEKIHDKWRKSELVRLKFHEVLARDMKTAHEVVERRTGGLVIWRSGSVMVVFRGSNYEGPLSKAQPMDKEGEMHFIPDVSSSGNSIMKNNNGTPLLEKSNVLHSAHVESLTKEEVEYNSMLDGLGPRFEEWWGTGVLPVDADLLPPTIPGFKTPFRVLPTGMRSRLTNAEMTSLRKLAKSLPCHFALGRNRNHQGLAAAIIKLWEKSLVVKIAVKRGIQNTNNELMAEELKKLTGGVLLLRNKYYIVMYRGKDFLPPTVAAALAERQEVTKQIQDVEERVRRGPMEAVHADKELVEAASADKEPVEAAASVNEVRVKSVSEDEEGQAVAGTLAEFYEAQARWGREISSEEHEKMIQEASRERIARVIKRLEHKLALAQGKKLKAEKILAKIVASWVPAGPSDDQETITEEERVMYRRVGLRMKSYLPLGIRGVFDGVIENMHLHWKHRELVKLLSKEKEQAFVEETGRLLEYESGGILVAIERVPKGYALIYYRGKNYRRPISIRPKNLLTKAKALKRRVALQRYEALSQHISELEKTIDQTKREIGNSRDMDKSDTWKSDDFVQSNSLSELSDSEDDIDSDLTDYEDVNWEDGDGSEFSSDEYEHSSSEGS